MSTTVQIDGKTLRPIKEAAEHVSYSRDYITRLAREKKIRASYVGRKWFVDLDSLQQYESHARHEQEVRKKHLSAERKREQELHQAVQKQSSTHAQRARSFHLRAMVTSSLVLSFGLVSGFLTHQYLLLANQQQVAASAQSHTPVEMRHASPSPSPTVPAAANTAPLPPTQEVESMGDVRNGVLLYPAATTTPVNDLFSDEVVVEEQVDGSVVLFQLDAAGEPMGEPIPVLTIPIVADTR